MSRLDAFFHPRSIAIVGASERGMYPAGILRNLLEHGYSGRLYPINPRRKTVFGLRCHPDVASLPETPDLAVIIVPRQAVLDVLEQCTRRGVPAALIITAGFGESDEEGKALQTKLLRLSRESAITVVGPNCAGLANIPGHVIVTRLPTPPRPGNVGFVSASGALMMALYGVFHDYHLGLSRLISLGNQVDVTLAEVLAYLVQDPATQVIGAFVEGVTDGPALVSAVRAAQAAGKPIILVKSGRTQAGQQAAATHTAALAGSDQVFQAVCQQFGLVLVDDVLELARTVQLFSAWVGRWPQGRRVALVTQSGGMGSLTADLCSLAGLELPPLSSRLQEKLQGLDHLLHFGQLGNPTDVRGASAAGLQVAETLAPFLEDDDADVVVLLLAKSAVREEDVATAQAIIQAAKATPKPLCVVWTGQRVPVGAPPWPLAHRLLVEAGIPIFEQPGDCVRALARVVAWRRGGRQTKDGSRQLAGRIPQPGAPIAQSPSHPIPQSPDHPIPRLLTYRESAALLARHSITLAPARLVASPGDAVEAANELGYPVVLKALSPRFSHKSDAGLVRLSLATPDAVTQAAQELLQTLAGHPAEGLLVQAMAPAGTEALVGLHWDEQFGPVLLCGPGGVLVELLDESALRLVPVAEDEARSMLTETRLGRLLVGLRGQPPGDAEALAALLVKLSDLALDAGERLVSLDLNPVIVLPEGQGLALVDVRIVWKGELT